jgi:enoyl-CoA hydratase/crotonobetainyl-CoA hydratase
MSQSPIRVDVRDFVATITLDRPEVRNAIDLPTAKALERAIDEAERRDDVRVIVLAATGPVFSAGMDLKALTATGDRPITRRRGAFGIAAQPPEKPTVAAVQGKALGGGLEIALTADVIVASQDAEFGLPEVKRGLIAAAGGVLRLPRRIPRNVALEMIMTGRPISAERAYEVGLVNRVVPPGHALDVAQELAREIAANAPLAVRMSKWIADNSVDWPTAELFDRMQPKAQVIRESKDAAEGAQAFVDKRQPVWTGA